MPQVTRAHRAASWIAEAVSTGNPLAPLPAELAPRTRAEGERVALLALAELGIPPCGVRVAGGVAGPMVEGRLHPSGTPLAGLRHPVATAALVGVLGAALEPGEDSPPALSAVHPALDVADSRFTAPPTAIALRAADLGGLGQVVVGEAAEPPADGLIVAGAGGAVRIEVPLVFRDAAAAARRLGGLPEGALLVAAGLAPLPGPDAEGWIEGDFGSLGTVRARIVRPMPGLPVLGLPG